MQIVSAFSTLPSNFGHFKLFDLKLQHNTLLNLYCVHTPNSLSSASTSLRINLRKRSWRSLKLPAGKHSSDLLAEESISNLDWDDQEQGEIEDDGSPWKDAIIYRRNPSILHTEYCTTLERLGLGKLSTVVSKSRASVMGLRVTKAVKDYPNGTPVLISLDVTRKKRKLRLDGIIRTVITLCCNRCGEPAAKSIFSNFSLLLMEELIEELETINMGVIYGDEKFRIGYTEDKDQYDDDNDEVIDIDDQLYFPPEEKEIDISKHIRDLVHVEITIDELCHPTCKGLCLRCGMNLNSNGCKCKMQEVDRKSYGPLGGLSKQIQRSI